MSIKDFIIKNKIKLPIIFLAYIIIFVILSISLNSCFEMWDTTGGAIHEQPSKLECFTKFLLVEPTWYFIMIISAIIVTLLACLLINFIISKFK